MTDVAAELDRILETAGRRMLDLDDRAAGAPTAPGKWSRKEIIGHLIDSAANNHQRFVRLQLEKDVMLPGYHQSGWVRTQNYAGRPWRDLVELWLAYNRHLAHIIRHADPATGGHVWKSPGGDLDLQFLISDYVVHLRHHLDQIFELP